MAAITFTDDISPASLRNAYPAPANRFANWTVMTRPFGDSVPRLSDGAITMFRHRTDYGVSFDIVGIPVRILARPTGAVATPSTTGGTLIAQTYYYKVTAILPHGETSPSAEAIAVVTTATGSVSLTWTAIPNALSYRVYRGTVTNAENVYFTAGPPSYTDTGVAPFAGSPPSTGSDVVAIADRLIAWLLQGGTCQVACEDVAGNTYPTCGLWPGSSPTLRMTDSRNFEFTLSLQLLNVAVSPGQMVCRYA